MNTDEHFDWLEIYRGFNYPMAQASACSHISPSDDRLLYIQARYISQIHINTRQWLNEENISVKW